MDIANVLSSVIESTLALSIAYSVLLFAFVVAMGIGSAAEHRYRTQTRMLEDLPAMARSPFALPISIVASAYNEEAMILASVRSLLAQDYPEFEVIVVNDGSTDRTFQLLQQEYALYPDTTVHQDILPHRAVGSVCFSAVNPRLIVITKENGGNKADAMNCGVNLARYPYICSVDGDTMYHPDAVLQTMAPVNQAPDEVIGVTSFFGNSREPEALDLDGCGKRTVDRHLLSNLQHLDLMRSFIATRLSWSKLNCMMCNPGGFAIWRREEFMRLGGFSNAFSCEDLEMTFRMHEKFRREGRCYRILSLPGMVARTEGPDRASSLIRQRARWQKVVLEVVWHYRRMLMRPGYGTVGMVALPYFLLFEALAPTIQMFSLLSLVAAIGLGLMDWPLYACVLGIVMFSGAASSALAVMLHDQGYHDYRLRDLARMLLIGPIDLFYYRPLIMLAGVRGTWQFLKGDRGWDKFERNVRAGTPAPAQSVDASP
jgi:biofilm PGA synthesis N-glycosyltransferase PgaC